MMRKMVLVGINWIEGRNEMVKKKRDVQYIEQQWTLLDTMLSGMYWEIDKLCRKKPDMLLSELKIKKINNLIEPIKELLEGENSFIEEIEPMDADDPVELSDAIIVLSELQKGLATYRKRYYDMRGWH